jgi:hypothetical protein
VTDDRGVGDVVEREYDEGRECRRREVDDAAVDIGQS